MTSPGEGTPDGSPHRILIVSNFYPPQVVGGAEIVAHRQARALRSRGHEVTVYAGGLPDGSAAAGTLSVENVDGITVYRIVHRSLDTDGNFHWALSGQRFLSILKALQPAVVHFHNVTGLGANLIPMSRREGVRTVITLHDDWGFCFKNTLLRNDGRLCDDVEQCAVCRPRIDLDGGSTAPIRLRRDYVAWCVDQADLRLAPSAYLTNAYNKSGSVLGGVRTLSNGIELSRVPVSSGTADEVLRFACFSYLGEHKGIPILLDALERLSADRDLLGRWHMVIAGHGHLAPVVERRIVEGRFGEGVSFAGRLAHPDALALLARSDVVVLPSVWPENEPVTMLEAIAAGKAQLASRIGGNIELVREDQSGLMFTAGSVEELVAAMRRYIREPELARRFGSYNAGRRSSFDEGLSIDRLERLYAEPAEDGHEEGFLVLCSGAEPAPHLDLLLHRAHIVEDARPRLRFVRSEWACASAWRAARLLWLWDEEERDLATVARALRAGVPILAPAGSTVADLAARPGGLGTYRSWSEALGMVTALQEAPEVARRSGDAALQAARLFNAIQPDAAFHLAANRA